MAKAQLDLPNAAIQAEIERLRDGARADLKQRGLKDADKAEILMTLSAHKPNTAYAWVWCWPNWCVPTTCKPHRNSSKHISTNWLPATKNRKMWCAGTSATVSVWQTLKP